MPEMPDVIGGEVVTSEWGNDIRDRSIQRYTDAADRTAEHPTPVNGDLSFLNNTGKVYVYYSGAWRTMYDDLAGTVAGYVKMGSDSETAFNAATTTFQSGASITFTKPAAWTGYDLMAWGTVLIRSQEAGGDQAPVPVVRVVIDGVPGNELDSLERTVGLDYPSVTIPANHIRGPLTASAVVAVQYKKLNNPPTVQKQGSTINYMAIRTS